MCTEIRLESSRGEPIRSTDDWLRYAPPYGGIEQWKDGRSAKELAKAWMRPTVPAEFRALFETHELTRGVMMTCAWPEVKIPLDDFAGEQRNSDLVVLAHGKAINILITVEAKADEEFGKLIGEYYESKRNCSSNVCARIDHLLKEVFGRELDGELSKLRYQLLTGFAGTVIEAGKQKAGGKPNSTYILC